MNDILEIIFKDHRFYHLLDEIKKEFIFSNYPHCRLFDQDQCLVNWKKN